MSNFVRRFGTVVGIMAMSMVALAGTALAQTTDAVDTAVSGASTTATGVITGNVGVVLAVAGAWVALTIGKKLIGKIS